jgi:SAM-dependent methyltransferase
MSENTDNSAPLLSSVLNEFSTDQLNFTGERFIFGSGIEIFYEHYHRYWFALNHISSSDVVMDLGCGIGYGSLLLSEKAKSVISVDVDAKSIDVLKTVSASLNKSNITAQVFDVNKIEELNVDKIDVVVCHELIEHISRDKQNALIKKIASGQKPFHQGTKLFISTPERKAYSEKNQHDNPFHEFEFSKQEFFDFINSDFSHSKFFWQSTVTGNSITEIDSVNNSCNTGFINWSDSNKSLGYATNNPIDKGVYLYSIASNLSLPVSSNSVVVDQSQKLIPETLAIAAKELNELNAINIELKNALEKFKIEQELSSLQADKIKALLIENEFINGQLIENRKELLNHREELLKCLGLLKQYDALDIRFVVWIIRKLPNFIRVSIQRTLALFKALKNS